MREAGVTSGTARSHYWDNGNDNGRRERRGVKNTRRTPKRIARRISSSVPASLRLSGRSSDVMIGHRSLKLRELDRSLLAYETLVALKLQWPESLGIAPVTWAMRRRAPVPIELPLRRSAKASKLLVDEIRVFENCRATRQ